MLYCPKCGSAIRDSKTSCCPICGYKLKQDAYKQEKEKTSSTNRTEKNSKSTIIITISISALIIILLLIILLVTVFGKTNKPTEDYNEDDGELPVYVTDGYNVNNNVDGDKAILLETLDSLTETYGIFNPDQTGTMTSQEDKWLNPAGILSATIRDFDSDGVQEMLVCISEECDHSESNSGDTYHIMMDMWETNEGVAVLTDSFLFSAYVDDDMYQKDAEATIVTASTLEMVLYSDLVTVDEHTYIVCQNSNLMRVLGDGSYRSYWVVDYTGKRFEYVCSFTQMGGASFEPHFTKYNFENGLMTSAESFADGEINYDETAESYGDAVASLFEKYGINLNSTIRNLAWVENDAYDRTLSILSEDNNRETIFKFENEITEADWTWPFGHYVFHAKLSCGNDLLDLKYINPVIASDKTAESSVLGEWVNDYDPSWFASKYTTTFNNDGTVVCKGMRETDNGTYEFINDSTILAVFDENYYWDQTKGDNVFMQDYSYTVTYTYDLEKGTLYAEYDDQFYEAEKSIANGSGALYR